MRRVQRRVHAPREGRIEKSESRRRALSKRSCVSCCVVPRPVQVHARRACVPQGRRASTGVRRAPCSSGKCMHGSAVEMRVDVVVVRVCRCMHVVGTGMSHGAHETRREKQQRTWSAFVQQCNRSCCNACYSRHDVLAVARVRWWTPGVSRSSCSCCCARRRSLARSLPLEF
jgi:hypothetical protein